VSGVLCCGNIVFDVLVRPVSELRWNTTHWVESARHTMGGNGANTAFALGLLGARVRLLGWVGPDPAGAFLLDKLAGAGVDLSGVRRGQAPTATTVSLVNPQGDRFLLHAPGVSLEAFTEPLELDAPLREGMTHFHLANLFSIPGLRRQGAELLRQARAAGLMTSMDTGWDQHGRWMQDLAPALAWTDLLFVNGEETLGLTGTTELLEAARVFAGYGVRIVVFKLGGEGCAVWQDGELVRAPAFEVEVVDTTGAGDCFAGAFLAALLRGLDPASAARFANAAAALSVTRLGATEGLRSWDETEAWMRQARLRRC
jgi:sugar/nucleoside kinase (ribokinase family)